MLETLVKNITEKFHLVTLEHVRVRFAPSPTGYFHIGSARTALFNYLFARSKGGEFILRIEDTDKERSKPEYEEDIIESLKWLGIEWDKGPYRQSERKGVYRPYLEKLIAEEKAYYCFCTLEDLEAKKQYQMSEGLAPMYDGKCSKLTKEEIEKKLTKDESCIIRFKMPDQEVVFDDLIRGKIKFDTKLIGDITIAKDLDTPLYNFSVVVDDYEMKITHVIRGEDLMPNTPKQILIAEALGMKVPKYAHLPLILGSDRSKLSKRDGATSLRDYIKDGYLKEAMINFLALLGWNPGNDKEIFSFDKLIKDFSLEKVQKSGAMFNQEKLDYLNGFYIRHISLDKLTDLCLPHLVSGGFLSPVIKSEQMPATFGGTSISYEYLVTETKESIDFESLKKMVGIYQERLKKISEIGDLLDYFMRNKLEYSKDLLIWKDSTNKETISVIKKTISVLSEIGDWDLKTIINALDTLADELGGKGIVLWPLRSAITGKKASAGPYDIVDILGKEKTLDRLKHAIKKLK